MCHIQFQSLQVPLDHPNSIFNKKSGKAMVIKHILVSDHSEQKTSSVIFAYTDCTVGFV
jgi:hypothetical protein